MTIVVDLNRCQGYGQCVFLAPEVFELEGDEVLMYDPGPDETQRLSVLRAAAACPVQAIRVETSAETRPVGHRRAREVSGVA
ncbi:MAG TPA: ferredoxin [Candidatus Dormibacteraeota bacterium]|jgi:ferredoxin|nr:ferredoxin [Candidatus Dormibacteraeota bacterium]